MRPAPPGGGGVWCDTPAVNLNHLGTGGSTVHSINMEIRATVASLTWDTQLIVCDITTIHVGSVLHEMIALGIACTKAELSHVAPTRDRTFMNHWNNCRSQKAQIWSARDVGEKKQEPHESFFHHYTWGGAPVLRTFIKPDCPHWFLTRRWLQFDPN